MSAQISDALFGLTRSPAAMSDRLRALSECVVGMLADDTQTIRVEAAVAGVCPQPLRRLVLRLVFRLLRVARGSRTRPDFRGSRHRARPSACL